MDPFICTACGTQYTPSSVAQVSRRSAAGKKYRAHLVEVRSLFAITSPSVHSVQRPENINNLYPVVTSRRESKRANAHRDWSHLALRKPATSRPVDGRYGGHRFSSAMHGRRIIIQTLHPAPELARIIHPKNCRTWSGMRARTRARISCEMVANCCRPAARRVSL